MSDSQIPDDLVQPSWPFPEKALPLPEVELSPPPPPQFKRMIEVDGQGIVLAKRVYPLFRAPFESGYRFYDG